MTHQQVKTTLESDHWNMVDTYYYTGFSVEDRKVIATALPMNGYDQTKLNLIFAGDDFKLKRNEIDVLLNESRLVRHPIRIRIASHPYLFKQPVTRDDIKGERIDPELLINLVSHESMLLHTVKAAFVRKESTSGGPYWRPCYIVDDPTELLFAELHVNSNYQLSQWDVQPADTVIIG